MLNRGNTNINKVYRGSTPILKIYRNNNIVWQLNTPLEYTLNSSLNTSAAIYKSDGTLVRTLWSNERKLAGTHKIYWDGKDDQANDVDISLSYEVLVLTNDVIYSWDGAKIGNSSTTTNINGIHRAGDTPLSICIAGGKLYYTGGYHEKYTSGYVTNLGDIGSRARVAGVISFSQVINCTDGTDVYWGGYGEIPNTNTIFGTVYATKVSDDTFRTFTNGVARSMNHGGTLASTVSYRVHGSNGSGAISSMSVQKTGNKLFVGRGSDIEVINKVTGDLINTITIAVSSMAIDNSDNLWIGAGSSVTKYTVNSDGTLTSTGVTITGITDAAAMAVSPDGATISIVDRGITQQIVKSFNNTTGASSWTLGTAGGYMNDATATNYKFYINDVRTTYLTNIAYQSDGSFWVIDSGNNRIQHYSSSRTYVDRISYLCYFYNVRTDLNNDNRLFAFWGGGGGNLTAGYLEFLIDYTKTLDNGVNGSWTLTHNWGATLPSSYNIDRTLTNIITLNGHTYGIASSKSGGNYDLFELVSNGVLRKTKITFSTRMAIGKDGSKYWNPSGNVVGTYSAVYKYAYTGLDSDNDPTWSSTQQTEFVTPTIDTTTPQLQDAFHENITSTNKWIIFDPQFYVDSTGTDPHLGAILLSDNNRYQWKTSYGTLRSYSGNFPNNGLFDNGNGVGGAGGSAGGFSSVAGTNIIWTYHGEFWKTLQTNMFNHYHESGLMVGQFGTLRTDYVDQENAPGGAGNVIFGSLIQYDTDTAYLYTGDEGVNSGVHRWKITGLSTINIITIPFILSENSPIADAGIDLMSEIVGKDTLTSVGRWTLSDTTYSPDGQPTVWMFNKGSKTASILGSQDIWVNKMYNPSINKYIDCNIGNNNLTSWSISGEITFAGNVGNNFHGDGAYFQVLDGTGKVIAQLFHYTTDFETADIHGNNLTLHHYLEKNTVAKVLPFSISNNNGTLIFNYAGFTGTTTTMAQTGAVANNPSKIRLLYEGGATDKGMGVGKLKLITS